uniref:Mitochondrial carrier protein n=1 Tax=viral metagenome TaxID=1070528 RepID=A0A6C0E916_9ZZZZ
MEKIKHDAFTVERWVAGAFAGVTRVTIGYPFDQIKIKMQMKRDAKFTLNKCLLEMWNDGLFKSLYRGSSLSFLFSTFQMSLNFGFKSLTEKKLIENSILDNNVNLRTFIAGSVGGFFHALTISPVDYLRIQQMALKTDSLKSTFRQVKLLDMTRGMQATMLRDIIGMGFYFTSFSLFSDYLKREYMMNHYFASLISGSLAGVCWWAPTYPFDISKTMLQKDISTPRKYKNMMATFRTLYAEAGMKGFVRGLDMCILRAIIVNAGVFVTADYIHTFLTN